MSIAIMSVLFIALGSVWLIAGRAMESSVAAAEESKAERVIAQLSSELRFAVAISNLTQDSVTLELPDRDNDASNEIIDYQWFDDGTGSGYLTRSYNYGAEVTLLEDVPLFRFSSMIRSVTVDSAAAAPPAPDPDAWGFFVTAAGGDSLLNGLIAHWKFDENSGSTAGDELGNHDGALSNVGWANGQHGKAVELDGDTGSIRVTNHSDFDLITGLSVTAWVRGIIWPGGTNVAIIARKGEGNPNMWQFAIEDGRAALHLEGWDGSGFQGNTVLNTNTWYHVAATWDGTTVKIYVDGVLDNGAGDPRAGPIGTDARDVYLGGRGTTDVHEGRLDEVRIYNRALSQDEITAIYEE